MGIHNGIVCGGGKESPGGETTCGIPMYYDLWSKNVFVIPLYVAPEHPKDGPYGDLPPLTLYEKIVSKRLQQFAMDTIAISTDLAPNPVGQVAEWNTMWYPVSNLCMPPFASVYVCPPWSPLPHGPPASESRNRL